MTDRATRFSWGDLLRGMGQWLRENLPQALVMSAVSFAFGWIVNFWVMAFRYDGFRAPSGSSDYITAQNSLVSASMFWAALTSFLFAVLAYGYRAGWGTLREEVFSLPSRISAMFKGEERNRSLTTLAWALALSLLLALAISPGVAAVTAGFFLFFAATPLGDLLAGVIRRLWMQVVARFAPHKGEPTSEVGAAAVTAAGMVAGFVIAATVQVTVLKILAVVLAALAAYYFANEDELGPTGGTAVFLLMAAAVGLYEFFEAGVGIALADDGGWSECGNCNVIDYITSTGATEVVSRSFVAGGASAVGAPIGAAIGDAIGSFGGGTGPSGGTGRTGGTGGGQTPPPSDPGSAAGPSDDDLLGGVAGGRGTLDPHTSADSDPEVTTAGTVGPAPQRRGPDDAPAGPSDDDLLGGVAGGRGTLDPHTSADSDPEVTTAGTVGPAPQRRGPGDAPAETPPAPDTADGGTDAGPVEAGGDADTGSGDVDADGPTGPSDDDLLGGVAGGRGTLDTGDTPPPPPPPGGGAEVPPARRQGPPDADADAPGSDGQDGQDGPTVPEPDDD